MAWPKQYGGGGMPRVFQAIADQANTLVALPVTITAGDTTFTASAADKASWITIPVTDDAPGTPSYEAAKVSDWVNAQAATLTVEPTTGVRNVSSTGTVLSVVKNATDGRSVSNAAGGDAHRRRDLQDLQQAGEHDDAGSQRRRDHI